MYLDCEECHLLWAEYARELKADRKIGPVIEKILLHYFESHGEALKPDAA